MNASKKNVALQAIDLLKTKLYPEMILGIGTGSTVNAFIDNIDQIANYFSAAVSSSNASTSLLRDKGINVLDLNDVNEIHFYIDGADEVDPNNFLIKGGGGVVAEVVVVVVVVVVAAAAEAAQAAAAVAAAAVAAAVAAAAAAAAAEAAKQ